VGGGLIRTVVLPIAATFVNREQQRRYRRPLTILTEAASKASKRSISMPALLSQSFAHTYIYREPRGLMENQQLEMKAK
jgi:hypothetical protein